MPAPEPEQSPLPAERLTPGTLYVVATPIGNLGDITARAKHVLAQADIVAAEDTRHTGTLLKALGLRAKELTAVHEHNERARSSELIERLQAGASVALVSDAGTPLISDPGFGLVRAAAQAGVPVVAIPGACAAIAALSMAGMPTDRFAFEGFMPSKSQARLGKLRELAAETRTLVFYEAPHRLAEWLVDAADAFGSDRHALVARELTKLYETAYRGTLGDLLARVERDAGMSRGEIVIVVEGKPDAVQASADAERTLSVLLEELSPAQAAKIASKLTGAKRSELYERAMNLRTRD